MPPATTPMKVAINFGLSTFLKITISGNDKAITLIMKARAVPRAAPFPSNASTTGMIPAALEYMGTPITTERGTDHQESFPIMDAMTPSGTKP